MKTKITMSIVCLMGLMIGAASLQAKPGAEGASGDRQARMKKHMERVAEKLELTDDQKNQLKAYHEEQGPRLRAIMKDESLDREQKKEQMKALREENQTFMESILSPEQLAKHQEMRSKMKDRIGEGKGKRIARKEGESTAQ